MSVARSPPTGSLHQCSSETDVARLDVEKLGRRQKRRRGEETGEISEHSLKSFREEMLSILKDWKADQDITLKKLCADVAEVKQQNVKIQQSNEDIEKAIDFLSKQYDNINAKVDTLERERKDNLAHIASLENKIYYIQKSLKSTVFEIRNVPASKPESKQDLLKIVQDTCNTLNVDVQPSQIKDIYRVVNKSGLTSVVAECTSTFTRDAILSGAKLYNQQNKNNKLSSSSIGMQGKSVPIYISESLTAAGRKLYSMARETAKYMEYKYCWIKNGKIFLRKTDGVPALEIKSESQLTTIKNSK